MNRTTLLKTVLFLSGGLLLSACGGDGDDDRVIPSYWVDTDEIDATIEIYADTGSEVNAAVQLVRHPGRDDEDEGDDYLDLREGDELWLTTGVHVGDVSLGEDVFQDLSDLAQTQELFTADPEYRAAYFFFWSLVIEGEVHYEGTLSDVEEEATYTVSLLRGHSDDATDSTVVMPRSFDLLLPEPNVVVSRSADPLTVEWLPLEDNVQVEVDVYTRCPNGADFAYQDTLDTDSGFIQLDAGLIDDEALSGNCSTTLTLVKTRFGQLDPRYRGGFISANQVRSVDFTTTN